MRFQTTSPSRGLSYFKEAVSHPRFLSFNSLPRIISVTVGAIVIFCIWVVPAHYKQSIITQTHSILPPSLKPHFRNNLISNGTLGFQKIYAIGLSERTDRRDSLEIAADATGLKLTWMDGVTPASMNPKTIPPNYKIPKVLPGVIGCWRSHMNVIRQIVAEKVSTALILEDDADWDVHLVDQMYEFSVGTKHLLASGNQKNKHSPTTNSPYGEGWDILWIGHCGGFQGNTSSVPHYIIKNDETVPPSIAIDDMTFGVAPNKKWKQDASDPPCAAHAGRDPPGKTCDYPRLGPKERIIQERAKPVCTAGYAISYQGARKLLARNGGLSLTDVFAPVDQGFGDVCSGWTDLPGERTRCFTPSPPYIRGYKAKGLPKGDSDIRKAGADGELRKVGWSRGIVYSTRLNANSIVSNVDFEPESQYVRDGPHQKGEWRLKKAHEYRAFREDIVVKNWVW